MANSKKNTISSEKTSKNTADVKITPAVEEQDIKENKVIEENKTIEENKELKNEIDILKAQIALMMKNMSNEQIKSSDDDDIVVISMCNWLLNLTTEPMGAGNVYQFTHFGEEQTIPKDDLKRIIKVNSKFIKEGLVYITDADFVKKEKLSTAYSKLIDLDRMKELLNADKSTFKKVFVSLPASQKEVLIDLITQRLIKDEEIDMNIVYICEEISGRSLTEEVNQAKEVLKEMKHN